MWKVHPDGTGAELILKGADMFLPEVSPDGRFVSYGSRLPLDALHVEALAGGSKNAFLTPLSGFLSTLVTPGRSRWMPDGRHLIFTDMNAAGQSGVFIQDFVPGQDTRATRKALAGFDPDRETESLGLYRDGSKLVLSESERSFNLLMIEGVPIPHLSRRSSR
jgi:hypothetical protein